MINEIVGDIFETDPITTVIVHQANCMNTMAEGVSSGIAGIIEKKYPEAREADAKTAKGDISKLGTLSIARSADGRIIVNMYSQFEFGGARPTNYEAFATGLEILRDRLAKSLVPLDLAIPYGIGSVRGGGRWRVVRAIIDTTFEDVPFNVSIYRLPSQADLD